MSQRQYGLTAEVDDEDTVKHATTIQKHYRGFKARQQVEHLRSSGESDGAGGQPRRPGPGSPGVDPKHSRLAADARSPRSTGRLDGEVNSRQGQGGSSFKARDAASGASSFRGDPQDVDRYATTIQRHYRGHQARREVDRIRSSLTNSEASGDSRGGTPQRVLPRGNTVERAAALQQQLRAGPPDTGSGRSDSPPRQPTRMAPRDSPGPSQPPSRRLSREPSAAAPSREQSRQDLHGGPSPRQGGSPRDAPDYGSRSPGGKQLEPLQQQRQAAGARLEPTSPRQLQQAGSAVRRSLDRRVSGGRAEGTPQREPSARSDRSAPGTRQQSFDPQLSRNDRQNPVQDTAFKGTASRRDISPPSPRQMSVRARDPSPPSPRQVSSRTRDGSPPSPRQQGQPGGQEPRPSLERRRTSERLSPRSQAGRSQASEQQLAVRTSRQSLSPRDQLPVKVNRVLADLTAAQARELAAAARRRAAAKRWPKPRPAPPPAGSGPITVYNRGLLREKLLDDPDWPEERRLKQWQYFMQAQAERFVPPPPNPTRRLLPNKTAGYRLRLHSIKSLALPSLPYQQRGFDVQLSVTMFDEERGAFYGNTCFSAHDGFDRQQAEDKRAVDLQAGFDVYYHTRISDPQCMAVAEVTLLERNTDGLVIGQYSLGFARLPLFQPPGDKRSGDMLEAQLLKGTPRYLQLRSVYGEEMQPPQAVPGCYIFYQAELFPGLDTYKPLIPEDFLVTYHDLVPGLRRFDHEGQFSASLHSVLSTLASPMLCPVYSLVLDKLRFGLHVALHDKLKGYNFPRMDQPTVRDIPAVYCLRVALHNGRRFVGPSLYVDVLRVAVVENMFVCQSNARQPPAIEWLLGDEHMMLVVELLLVPAQGSKAEFATRSITVGWGTIPPFSQVAPDGSGARLRPAPCHVELGGSAAAVLLRGSPVLNWRALLLDGQARRVPPPTVEFDLLLSGRPGIAPPSKLAIFEEEEVLEEPDRIPAGQDEGEESDSILLPGPPSSKLRALMGPPQDAEPVLEPSRPASRTSPRSYQSPQPSVSRRQTDSGKSLVPLPSATPSMRPSPRLERTDTQPLPGRPLSDMTAAMQHQLNQLTQAVDELRQERASLRQSLTSVADLQRDALAAASSRPQQVQHPTTLALEHLDRLRAIPATKADDLLHFGGGATAATPGAVPRSLLALLHEAGATDALPADVREVLRRRPPTAGPSAPIHLDIESRDPRIVSDVIVQLLAMKPHEGSNGPARPSALYFTYNFFNFAGTRTEQAYLSRPSGEGGDVMLLTSTSQQQRGAGIVNKHVVDGAAEPASNEKEAASAAYEQHMSFCHYLANRMLAIDVWDGDSQLQLGTASVELQGLLRQGRDFSELLLEVPVLDHQVAWAQAQAPPGAAAGQLLEHPAGGASRSPVVSVGSLVVRLINIGREASVGPRSEMFDDAQPPKKKMRVRVKPAPMSPQSPIARMLSGRVDENYLASVREGASPRSPSPARTPYSPYSPSTPFAWDTPPGSPWASDRDQENVTVNDIISFETRKVQRTRQLKDVLRESRGAGDSLPDQQRSDFAHSMQAQALADVDAARRRAKPAIIRAALQRRLLVRKVLRPDFGGKLVYEHEFINPFGREAVFELQISHPEQLRVISSTEEYKALLASGIKVHKHGTTAVGPLERELSGSRLFLAAGESLTLPFQLQSFQAPPEATLQLRTSRSMAELRASQAEGQVTSGHAIVVDLVEVNSKQPVAVVELAVAPRNIIVDRTLRFYHGEKELMKQSIKLAGLPGAEASFGGAKQSTLTVSCSDPQVMVAITGGGGGGSALGCELMLKLKCGSWPQHRHFYVLLYSDRFMTRALETWQVFVHSVRKVDLAAVVGQTSHGSVLLRGTDRSRKVRCYSSHPSELKIAPDAFVLVAGGLTEVTLSCTPLSAGRREVRVHIVDEELRELVYAVLVALDVQVPLVSRTFEIELPVGSTANKKVSYTNPYQQLRSFQLKSNMPWLLYFSPPRVEIPPSATRPLGFTFDARNCSQGVLDVLVFLNDEDDKNEECFKIRVTIFKP